MRQDMLGGNAFCVAAEPEVDIVLERFGPFEVSLADEIPNCPGEYRFGKRSSRKVCVRVDRNFVSDRPDARKMLKGPPVDKPRDRNGWHFRDRQHGPEIKGCRW